nr:uncharacterized protein LOC129385491 [Dermacentor andersoni]
MAAAPKSTRVLAAPATMLIEFIEQHPYLSRGATSLSPSMSAARKKAICEEIAAVLNAIGPAVKTARCWRLYWARLCYDCRRIAAQVGTEKRTIDSAAAPQATSATATGRCGLQGSR